MARRECGKCVLRECRPYLCYYTRRLHVRPGPRHARRPLTHHANSLCPLIDLITLSIHHVNIQHAYANCGSMSLVVLLNEHEHNYKYHDLEDEEMKVEEGVAQTA